MFCQLFEIQYNIWKRLENVLAGRLYFYGPLWQGDSVTHLVLITPHGLVWSKGHQESCNVVLSQSQMYHW